MPIIASRNISGETEAQIRSAEKVCNAYDGLAGKLYLDSSMNASPDVNSVFAYYSDDRLVSVLTVFMPGSDEAEITGFTLPKERRKGYFGALLITAIREMQNNRPQDLLFVCETHSSAGKKMLKAMCAQQENTEYLLKYPNITHHQMPETPLQLELRRATANDVAEIAALSMSLFRSNQEEAKQFINRILESENRIQYFALLSGRIVGMASILYEGDEATVFGVGISPECQGEGHGTTLLHLLVDEMIKCGVMDASIEVDSTNEKALKLYQAIGFRHEAEFDYYRMKFPDPFQ